jgi:hypothetical protein
MIILIYFDILVSKEIYDTPKKIKLIAKCDTLLHIVNDIFSSEQKNKTASNIDTGIFNFPKILRKI